MNEELCIVYTYTYIILYIHILHIAVRKKTNEEIYQHQHQCQLDLLDPQCMIATPFASMMRIKYPHEGIFLSQLLLAFQYIHFSCSCFALNYTHYMVLSLSLSLSPT